MTRVFKHMGTGLISTLSLLLIATLFVIPCHASTVDDLRDSIGMTKEKQEEQDENKYEVIIEKKNSTDESGNAGTTTSTSEQYNQNLIRLESRLEQYINENASANTMVATVNNIITIKKELDANTKDKAYQNMGIGQSVTEQESSITSQFSKIESSTITSEEYSIGDIGDTSVSITEDYRILVTPWGFTLKDDKVSEKFMGVDFGTRIDDKIKSQWNGIVTDIVDDGVTGGKKITIFHGNGLYTQYSHVKPLDNVSSGYEVYQGEPIGTAIDTTSAEPNKRCHIFYQVILDNNYINPLLVYGNSGKNLYDNWYKSTSDINVIEEGEEYFIEESFEDITNPENYKQGNADEVLYPNFNITD